MSQNYRHKRLMSSPSFHYADMPRISRARKVSTEADIVVSFIKSRKYIPYSSSFEKKFYLKRNSDIVEQRMCYNSRFDVTNKKEFLKVLKLVADTDQAFLEKAIDRGCINEAPCSSFVRSNLLNVLSINTKNCGNATQSFVLKSVSYDAFFHKYTRDDNNSKHSNEKIAALKNIISRQKEEKKIGDLYFEFTSEDDKNVSFYVIMACYEKQCSLKSSNTKQRLKKALSVCTQEIRKYNLPVPLCVNGQLTHENNFQEMLSLDMWNWKVLDYKFKSSKDESFYKQIRRRNRALTEV